MNEQNKNLNNGRKPSPAGGQAPGRVPRPVQRPVMPPVRGGGAAAKPAAGSGAAGAQMPPVRNGASAQARQTDQPTRKIDTEEILRTLPKDGVRRVPANTAQRRSASAPSTPIPAQKKGVARTPASAASNKDGREKKKKTPGEDGEVSRGIISNSVKAVIYLVCVLVVSGCLSLALIFVGNDVFAFVKDSYDVTVTVPQGATLGDIAEILGDNGVIKYPSIFKMYVNLRKKAADEYLYGDFTVSPSMPYDTLISTFKRSAAKRTEITITFTEGMTVDDVIDKFLENNIGTRERFIDVIQNHKFDYWFVEELDKALAENPNSGRKYRLEGYLFPDTYNFYSDSTEEAAIARLLDNFNSKFDENYRLTAKQMGYTCDEIVTLASMIQKEAKFNNDYPLVSSVFHNRLEHTDVTGGKLESNATVQYTMPPEEVQLALSLEDIEKYDNAYNTYKYAGLPVGPICSPSLNALYFSLYPQDSDYYYFISDSTGFNLYARTWQEHQKNRQKVEAGS